MKKFNDKIINLIGKENFGKIEYYLRPGVKEVWGGGFNGQKYRMEIFKELAKLFEFSAIIETGTHRGSTTEDIANKTDVPIYTVECNPRFYAFAKKRLSKFPKVNIYLNDSRIFLNELSENKVLKKGCNFFYLDAHWGEDLPLIEEINTVFSNWPESIVMIDDFQVPGDNNYGYQSYFNGKSLTLEYIQPLLKYNLRAFFPKKSSAFESGARRGCVVLALNEMPITKLRSLKTLREN